MLKLENLCFMKLAGFSTHWKAVKMMLPYKIWYSLSNVRFLTCLWWLEKSIHLVNLALKILNIWFTNFLNNVDSIIEPSISISGVPWLLLLLLILVNFLVNTLVKIHVDSVICAILPQEVQIVQNVQRFATLVSINVIVYAKLVRPNVQNLVLQQQLLFKLRLLFPEHRKL